MRMHELNSCEVEIYGEQANDVRFDFARRGHLRPLERPLEAACGHLRPLQRL